MTTTSNDTAPVVRFEACAAYGATPDCPWQTCAGCGWPPDDHDDDHGLEDALVVSVVGLRCERVPLRRAS